MQAVSFCEFKVLIFSAFLLWYSVFWYTGKCSNGAHLLARAFLFWSVLFRWLFDHILWIHVNLCIASLTILYTMGGNDHDIQLDIMNTYVAITREQWGLFCILGENAPTFPNSAGPISALPRQNIIVNFQQEILVLHNGISVCNSS